MSRPYRVSRSLLLVLGLAVAAPAVVSAQAAGPTMRSGLWDSAMDMGGVKIASQICMDGTARSSMAALRPQTPGSRGEQNCSRTDIHPIAGGYAVDTLCTAGRGVQVHTTGTMTGDFKNHYRVDMTIAADGRPEQKVLIDSTRLGDCPADMKPGEARMKMNGVDMSAAIAAARARAGGQ